MTIAARAIKFGDDINTDYIISGKHKFKSNDMVAMAVHAMEDVDPHYYEKAKPEGAFLVAGSNFGMGSSREQAPLVLIHSNTKAVLAKSSRASSTATRSTPGCRSSSATPTSSMTATS